MLARCCCYALGNCNYIQHFTVCKSVEGSRAPVVLRDTLSRMETTTPAATIIPVRPLDEVSIPPALDGRHGDNRADPARLQISANCDADAIR